MFFLWDLLGTVNKVPITNAGEIALFTVKYSCINESTLEFEGSLIINLRLKGSLTYLVTSLFVSLLLLRVFVCV